MPGGKCWEFLRRPATDSGCTGDAAGSPVIHEWAPVHWPHMGGQHQLFTGHAAGNSAAEPYPLGKSKWPPDGVLWAPLISASVGLNPKNGAYSPYCGVCLLASEDSGHHWQLRSWINYIPDNEEYENAFLCSGYCEPDLEWMPDGSMLLLMRVTGVFLGDKEWAPSYLSRSVDGGNSWSKPVRFDDIGVLPRMCRLGKDLTLAIYGRPGIYLRATKDPAGLCWEQPGRSHDST